MSVVAVGITAAVGAGATAYAAKSASDSASEANKTNAQNVADTNRMNYQMFLQSRGSQGSALLPTYIPQGTEASLANDALQSYYAQRDAAGTPSNELAGYQNIINQAQPSIQEGNNLVNQLFSGDLTNQQLGFAQPVLEARQQLAGTQKQGVLDALSARLSAIGADRARAGYAGGGSTLERTNLNQASIPAMQAAAGAKAQADLANATDVAAIKNQGIATQLNNLNLPITRAASQIQLQQMPQTALQNSAANRLGTFNWFKLNPQAFQNQPLPLVQPNASTGQIVGQGISSLATGLGNYYVNQQLANQMNAGGQQNYNLSLDQLRQQQAVLNTPSYGYYSTGQ